jgi:hypothetical protein
MGISRSGEIEVNSGFEVVMKNIFLGSGQRPGIE